MVWFKVDDSLALHPKALAAGNAAMGLWVRAGSWSSQQLTGGFIPFAVVPTLGGRSKDAQALVASGLWLPVDGGYRFHQWDDRQPTKDSVEADREASRERQRKARERAREARESRVTAPEVTDTRAHPVTVPPTRPDPTRPDPTRPDQLLEDLPSDKPKPKARRRPVAGFELSDGMRAWAANNEPAVDVDRETAKFVDHFTGTGDVKSDWTATWRNWVRRAAENGPRAVVPSQRSLRAVGSTTDTRVSATLALAEKYREEGQ